MSTQASRPRRAMDLAGRSRANADGLRQKIEALHREQNFDGVRDEAMKLTARLDRYGLEVGRLESLQSALRQELEKATAPEHYSVVITKVQENGRLTAEVAGIGPARVEVLVNDDVDSGSLKIGSRGYVNRTKNCLLKVCEGAGRWTNVGTFEERLTAPNRILVRDRENLIAVDLAHNLLDATFRKGDRIGFDGGDVGMAYEILESATNEHLFDEHVTDDFDQLGGLDAQIKRIKRHVDQRFAHPQIARKYNLKSTCGILLRGAPGNGKTRIARCTAGYVRHLFPDQTCRFMHVSGSSDYNMWFGESERKIIERFDAVREAAESGLVVMFWDEVDAIARRRNTDPSGATGDRILNTFLSQLDGVVPLTNVIVMFATNRADTLDPGLLRPGRTDEKIEIPAPNRRASQAILRGYLDTGIPLSDKSLHVADLIAPLLAQLFAPNGTYSSVAKVKLSDGRSMNVPARELLSGAMLENVVHMASQDGADREAATGQEGITVEDLMVALQREIRETVSLLTPENVKSWVNSIPTDANPINVERVDVGSTSFVRPGPGR